MNSTPLSKSVISELTHLLSQIQNHSVPFTNALLLWILLSLPIPSSIFTVSERLSVYHKLLPFFSFVNLPPIVVLLILMSWPFFLFIFAVFLFFLVKYFFSFVRLTLSYLLNLSSHKDSSIAFLKLSFPSDTTKSAYATTKLYALLHALARQKNFRERITGLKKTYSLEVVATKKEGIRFILSLDKKSQEIVKRSLLSFLPGVKIEEVGDYLKDIKEYTTTSFKITELKLSSHFALPLSRLSTLSEHDFIAYLTGNMTKLSDGELISFQIITTPVTNLTHGKILREIKKLKYAIYRKEPLSNVVLKSKLFLFLEIPIVSIFWFFIKTLGIVIKFILLLIVSIPALLFDSSGKMVPIFATDGVNHNSQMLNPLDEELQAIVKQKLDQELFETSIRILVKTISDTNLEDRIAGILASFGPLASIYQQFETKGVIFEKLIARKRLSSFKNRVLSKNIGLTNNPILCVSEIADIYHFPYTDVTKTEDLVKSLSSNLPAPLSMKQGKDFDVIVGKNTYAGVEIPIGLSLEDRYMHQAIYGGTGKGKSTLILYMLSQDIASKKGVGLLDPDGDLAEEVIGLIPKERKEDFVYFNPFEIGMPVAINILELSSELTSDELEIEKEFVTEGVVSLFRREFAKEGEQNAHRLEYILRNCIYTAYTMPKSTIFTVYDLLNDPKVRRDATKTLTDERLRKFWKNEMGSAGDFQRVKMAFGVTSKIGRFLFSPMARRILDNEKSSINFDELLNGKIFIANLSRGNLGEDTSELLGKMILTKIQLAANKRARIKKKDRSHFFLYVDEFQHFATKSFVEMMSKVRKNNVHLVIIQQSTSQQERENLTNLILANAGIVVIFRTAAPMDEEMLLPLLYPHVKKGEIQNLPAYNFYIKISAISSEEAFSGETVLTSEHNDEKKVEDLKKLSRSKYSIDYKKLQGSKEKEEKQARIKKGPPGSY